MSATWPSMPNTEIQRQDFVRYFPHAPTALCIKECARLNALRRFSLNGPLLDVGCGDGVFATLAFEGIEAWGIDINEDELNLAKKSQAYAKLIAGDITQTELPEAYFESCVANCSLEHVPRIDLALQRIARALKPGGLFITFVPNLSWTQALTSYRILERLAGKQAAGSLQTLIDDFFVHHHLHDADGWREIVEASPLELTALEPVLSSATTTTFELFLLPSLAGFVNKKLTKRWTNLPQLRRFFASSVHALAQRSLSAGKQEPSAEFLIVARRPG